MYYYGDVWSLDLASGAWSLVQPAHAGSANDGNGQAVPSARDHHSVALFRGEMVVFGG